MHIVFGRIYYIAPQGSIDTAVIKTLVEDSAIDTSESITIGCERFEQRCTPTSRATQNEKHLTWFNASFDILENRFDGTVHHVPYARDDTKGCEKKRTKCFVQLSTCPIPCDAKIPKRDAHRPPFVTTLVHLGIYFMQ